MDPLRRMLSLSPPFTPEVKPSRISVLCQMDEATLAALPFCLYMDSHCKSTHGGTRTTHTFFFPSDRRRAVKGQVNGDLQE